MPKVQTSTMEEECAKAFIIWRTNPWSELSAQLIEKTLVKYVSEDIRTERITTYKRKGDLKQYALVECSDLNDTQAVMRWKIQKRMGSMGWEVGPSNATTLTAVRSSDKVKPKKRTGTTTTTSDPAVGFAKSPKASRPAPYSRPITPQNSTIPSPELNKLALPAPIRSTVDDVKKTESNDGSDVDGSPLLVAPDDRSPSPSEIPPTTQSDIERTQAEFDRVRTFYQERVVSVTEQIKKHEERKTELLAKISELKSRSATSLRTFFEKGIENVVGLADQEARLTAQLQSVRSEHGLLAEEQENYELWEGSDGDEEQAAALQTTVDENRPDLLDTSWYEYENWQ